MSEIQPHDSCLDKIPSRLRILQIIMTGAERLQSYRTIKGNAQYETERIEGMGSYCLIRSLDQQSINLGSNILPRT